MPSVTFSSVFAAAAIIGIWWPVAAMVLI